MSYVFWEAAMMRNLLNFDLIPLEGKICDVAEKMNFFIFHKVVRWSIIIIY